MRDDEAPRDFHIAKLINFKYTLMFVFGVTKWDEDSLFLFFRLINVFMPLHDAAVFSRKIALKGKSYKCEAIFYLNGVCMGESG